MTHPLKKKINNPFLTIPNMSPITSFPNANRAQLPITMTTDELLLIMLTKINGIETKINGINKQSILKIRNVKNSTY